MYTSINNSLSDRKLCLNWGTKLEFTLMIDLTVVQQIMITGDSIPDTSTCTNFESVVFVIKIKVGEILRHETEANGNY